MRLQMYLSFSIFLEYLFSFTGLNKVGGKYYDN